MTKESTSSILQIQLLGGFRLVYDNGTLTERFSPRAQTLLAYLLLHQGQPLTRSHVAYTFWPDSSDAQARTNLRRELHGLRQSFPDMERFLKVGNKTLSWKSDSAFALDVARFRREIQNAEDVDDVAAQKAALEEAIALYSGDLLPGHYDEWLLAKQEELRQLYLLALERLIGLLYAERAYTATIQTLQKLLQVDPLHEAGYRQLMELYAQDGKRAQALHAYHSCVTLFERELGVAPGTEIEALYEQLLQSEETVTSLSGIRSGGTKLVGRQPEWQTILAAWRKSSRGAIHFVLIEGEAGIGKTRLGEELLEWVSRQGIASARTRSYAAEGSLAYAPVIEWLRSDLLSGFLETLDGIWRTEMARLLPELLVEQPNLPAPEPMTERHQRQRLFEALARAFTANQQPMLLLIDDLQWCDQETLEWLRFMVRFDIHAPLLIIGTARSEEVDVDHPLRTLTTELQVDNQLTTIELAPLSAEETATLSLQEYGDNLVDETAEKIFLHSEGNPLFVVEMVRSGHFESIAEAESDRTTELPPKVYAVIQHRLSTLSPIARSIASLAATIGRGFSFEVLVAASDQNEDEVVNGLDELWRRKVVREQGGSGYDFGHDRIREAAYAALSPVRRRVLHRKVAGALEGVYGGDLDSVSGRLGSHYEQAGLAMEAVAWYRRTGEVSETLFAYREAAEYLRRSLAQFDILPATEKSVDQRVEILISLREMVVRAHGFASPESEAVTLHIEQSIDKVKSPYTRYQALQQLRNFYVAGTELGKTQGLEEQLTELLKEIDDPLVHAGAFQSFGLTNLQLGYFQAAKRNCERAEEICEKHALLESEGGVNVYIRVLAKWALVCWLQGYPEQAALKAKLGFELASKLTDLNDRHVTFFLLSLYFRHVGDNQIATKLGQALHEIDMKSDIAYARFSASGLQGSVLAALGNFEEGIRLMRACVDGYSSTRHTMLQPHRYLFLIEGQFDAGRFDDALATIDEAFALAEYSSQPSMNAEFYRIRGEILLAQGASEDEVRVCYQRAISIAEKQAAKMFTLRATMSLSRLWARQGQRDEAQQMLQEIYDWFTEGFETVDLVEARDLLDELTSKR